MNTEQWLRLRKLRDFIAGLRLDAFEWGVWFDSDVGLDDDQDVPADINQLLEEAAVLPENRHCGTHACVAGWAAFLWQDEWRWRNESPCLRPKMTRDKYQIPSQAFAQFFGIPQSEADMICYEVPSTWHNEYMRWTQWAVGRDSAERCSKEWEREEALRRIDWVLSRHKPTDI